MLSPLRLSYSKYLIRWAPQLNVAYSIARGTTKQLPPEQITGLEDEDEFFVNWWKAIVQDGQRRPGPVHTFIVTQ